MTGWDFETIRIFLQTAVLAVPICLPLLAIVATIVTNVLSLILALGLNSKIRFKGHCVELILFLMYLAHWS